VERTRIGNCRFDWESHGRLARAGEGLLVDEAGWVEELLMGLAHSDHQHGIA
jgi:hypothetical protein